MASDMILSSDNPSAIMDLIMTSPSSSSSSSFSPTAGAGAGASDGDCFDDGCSICLEPFNSHDPPTVTICKHEYHLQCILEWSQRSSECPICCQLLVLKDPTSQELLAAAKIERSSRSRSNVHAVHEVHEVNHDASYLNDSDLEEQILQHFAAATSRGRYVNRSRRQTSSGIDSSEAFTSVTFQNGNNLGHRLEVGLATTRAPASTVGPEISSMLPSLVNVTSDTVENRRDPVNHRTFFGQQSPDCPQRSSSSEFLTFSESVKAKLSAASARYKESITKSTRGFKEKLLARNATVKELSRGVQREMTAGIAGVARMIERFDLSSKKTCDSVSLSSSTVETPNLEHEGKCVEESDTTQHPVAASGDITQDMSSGVSSLNSATLPAQVEVSLI